MNEIKHEIKEINKNNNNTEYNISVSIPMSLGYVNDISFCVYKDNFIKTVDLKHTNNLNGISYFNGNTSLDKSNLYHYFIKYKINNITHYLKDDSFKISSLYNTPSWSQGGVIYHIFVDRFNKGRKEELTPMKNRVIHRDVNEEMVIGPDSNGIWNNDFYGGDLRGIIEKLDYIKSLGTTIIYLSPIMLSQSNHRYDTSDYEMIDPYVGNNEDLSDALVTSARLSDWRLPTTSTPATMRYFSTKSVIFLATSHSRSPVIRFTAPGSGLPFGACPGFRNTRIISPPLAWEHRRKEFSLRYAPQTHRQISLHGSEHIAEQPHPRISAPIPRHSKCAPTGRKL